MKLSIVIPAHNEEGSLPLTVRGIVATLAAAEIPHEIVVVDDSSTDGTACVANELRGEFPQLTLVRNDPPNGFGFAVRRGLGAFTGEAVAIMMADASDEPKDLVAAYRKLEEGFDCVFGTRFTMGGRVVDYPPHKLILNRFANWFISFLFTLRYNDVTNAFKVYRREVIAGIQPLLSNHFNLTVEMPLKAVVRGFSFTVIPMNWYNRKAGISKLRIQEMGSRYLFIVLYVWLEKYLSRGDYKRQVRTDG